MNQQVLLLTLQRATNLQDADWLPGAGESDPFAVLRIEVDGKAVSDPQRSTTKNNNGNPEWGEQFRFNVDQAHVARGFLCIDVRDQDEVGISMVDLAIQDDSLGKVRIPLAQLLQRAKGQDEQFPLDQKGATLTISWTVQTTVPGIVQPVIPAVPGGQRTSELTVTLVSAHNLQDSDWLPGMGESDVFAILAVGTNGKAQQQPKKSSTKNNTSNPVWNEPFQFQIGQEDIGRSFLYIDVKDQDKTGVSLIDWAIQDDALGQVKIPLAHMVHNATGQPMQYQLDAKGATLVISWQFQSLLPSGPAPVVPQIPAGHAPVVVPQVQGCHAPVIIAHSPCINRLMVPGCSTPSYTGSPVVRTHSYSLQAPSCAAQIVTGPAVRVPSYSAVTRTPSWSVPAAASPCYPAYPLGCAASPRVFRVR